jgi:hypothetical protein
VNTLTGSIDFSFQTQIFALHLKMKGDQDSKMEKKIPKALQPQPYVRLHN